MSLTSQLVQYINNKAIDETDLQAASSYLLDALATAYAGQNTIPGRKVMQWAKQQGHDAGRKAFIMGALTHITETDDLHRASVTHPGCVVVPAALAVGEEIGASGREILIAILKGFEAMCRIGMAVGPAHYKIWHNTATCGPFGSAMAVGSLLGLNDEQLVHALGNAGTQSSGLWEFLKTGAMSKHLHAGRAAESGLLAAQLAAFDFTGPAEILEGEKAFFKAMCDDPTPELVLSNPEADWQLKLTSIKPWPSCRHTHPTIDACQELRQQIKGEEITKLEIHCYQTAQDVCDRALPNSEYEAKFSLQHCAAIALLRDHVGLDSFDDTARADTSNLRDIAEIHITDPYNKNYPKEWGAEIVVHTDTGKILRAKRIDCKGDPELPLLDAEMLIKADGLLRHCQLDAKARQKIYNDVKALPHSNQNSTLMRDFFHLVAP